MTRLAAGAAAAFSLVAMSAQSIPIPITLSNGQITLDLQRPDPSFGFYRGSRFDWSGIITRLDFGGHRFYGPWFARTRDVRDYVWEGDEVVAGPASAATGPVDEFSTDGRGLGYDEAAPGGTFIKIGVGVLRRLDGAPYSMFTDYPIVDPGRWTVDSTTTSATFRHVLSDASSGYGYAYEKTVRLAQSSAQMTLAHVIRNTGSRPIVSRVYNHNFLVLDGRPTGPDVTITMPFSIRPTRSPNPTLAEVQDRRIVYKAELQPGQTVSVAMEGFGPGAADNQFAIEHAAAGVGMRVTGDRPLASVSLWSIRPTIAVEPFVSFTVAPGESFDWSYVYTYYQLPGR